MKKILQSIDDMLIATGRKFIGILKKINYTSLTALILLSVALVLFYTHEEVGRYQVINTNTQKFDILMIDTKTGKLFGANEHERGVWELISKLPAEVTD